MGDRDAAAGPTTSMNPVRLIKRLVARFNRRLAELNVDDTELEDEQEPLYEHGNKMEGGAGTSGVM
jgi:hypothetical protein